MGVMTLRRKWFESAAYTSLNVEEVPVATKRLGEDRNVKSEITVCSETTPQ